MSRPLATTSTPPGTFEAGLAEIDDCAARLRAAAVCAAAQGHVGWGGRGPPAVVRPLLAVVLASVNIFGGFAVTARMLAMYKKKEKK